MTSNTFWKWLAIALVVALLTIGFFYSIDRQYKTGYVNGFSDAKNQTSRALIASMCNDYIYNSGKNIVATCNSLVKGVGK